MQARVVVFPVKGRAWCFACQRATAPAVSAGVGDGALPPPPTVKDLRRGIATGERTASDNAEAIVDFVADKLRAEAALAGAAVGGALEVGDEGRLHARDRAPGEASSVMQIDMKDFLKDMGLELPFLHDADFSDMVKEDDSSRPLFLSDVLHKAILEVDDKGIEETSVASLHQHNTSLPTTPSSLSLGRKCLAL